MARYKISQDHEACIGCGACIATCPGNWEMADDGKAKPKRKVDDLECNEPAADGCPVGCITVEEVKGSD
jgi:ferredoxin